MSKDYEWNQSAVVRCYRAYLGLSVPKMAKQLNVSVRSYQNFESGRAAIPVGILTEIEDLVAESAAPTERLEALAATYADQDTLILDGLSPFEMLAAGMAVHANPDLRVAYEPD